MSFKVIYDINHLLLRQLELIAQTNGNLQVLRMNSDWAHLLESKARIEEAVGSIGIEGTVISIDQARAITAGEKDVVVGEKERREFVGYYESLEYVKSNLDENLSIKLLLSLHEKVTRGDKEAMPGQIRSDQRYVKSKGKVIFTPPPPDQLGFLLKEFFEWFNKVSEDKNFSPVIAGAVCHFWFVWIHPFADGNGRVSRLLTAFMLLKKKSEGVKYFALSDFYNKNKDRYYDALEKTNICDPKIPSMNFSLGLDIWLSFFIDSYKEQMSEIKEITNRILQLNIRIDNLRKKGLITESHNKALSYLKSHERASYDELTKYLEVSKPRVHQILNSLREAQILVEEQIGKTKWFKLGSPEDEPDESKFKKKLKSKTVDKFKKIKEKYPKQAVLPIF